MRAGDKVFAHGGWATKAWYAAAEVRMSPFDVSPRGAFACLERLSGRLAHSAPASSGPAHGGRRPASEGGSGGGCFGCVVVSDSEQVEQCARRALPAVAITPGVPVHLAASAANLTDDPLNVQVGSHLVPSDPFRSLLIPSDPFWSLLVPSDPFRSLLVPSDPISSSSVPSGPL